MKTKIKITLYAICLLFSLSGLVWAEDIVQIPIEFTNRDFLENAKWTDASFFHRITAGWDTYTGDQGIEGKEVLFTKNIQIYDVVFSVDAMKFISDGVFVFVFKQESHFSKDFREKFMNYAVKTWGAPSKNIDYSGSGKERSVHHETEWLLKNTHIRFTIMGAEMYNSWIPGLCILFITQQGKFPPLKELITLKCEGQRRFFGFRDSTEITREKPFVIIVDLNHNTLRRRDKSRLGEITQTSDDYFISEWEDKDTKHRFVIDRKLGTYEWKITQPDKNWGMVNWGNCQKTDVQLEPKF
jgi:hypothetical protein